MRSLATSLVFLLAAGLFLFLCRDDRVRSGVGDEPHYLIAADSFAHFDGAQIVAAYLSGPLAASLLQPADFAQARMEIDAGLDNVSTFHGRVGPHGIVSIHNIGLPLLITPLRWLGGGMLAVKFALLLCSAMVPLLAVRAAGLFQRTEPHRLLLGAALCLTTPFLIPASQLYPDLLAGILFTFVLLELYIVRSAEAKPVPATMVLCAAALALAPWLHIRLAVPTLICMIGWIWLAKGARRALLSRVLWALAPAASIAALALYNQYAYGHLGGAYDKSSVEVSPTAVMVLFGLQIDQFQGIFVRAPLLLGALPGLMLLARRDWPLALLFLLVYGALVGPNAFHPNWYGGGSFAGRFVLAGAVTLILPAALALGMMFERWPRATAALCAGSLAMQGYVLLRFIRAVVPIFNQPADQFLEDYSSPVGHSVWLPAFYRLDLALHHWPNLAWLIALVCLLAAGWATRGRAALMIAACAIICVGGIAGKFERPIWQLIPLGEAAAYARERPTGRVHVVYGDPAEFATATLLVEQLKMTGIQACVEPYAPEEVVTVFSRVCEQASDEPRLALVKTTEWHIVPLQSGSRSISLVDFLPSLNAGQLTDGWLQPENWGVWSAARSAKLTFDLLQPPTGVLRLDLDAVPFLPTPATHLLVRVDVDGRPVAEWRYSQVAPAYRISRSLWIPADLVAGKTHFSVDFHFEGAVSQKDAGTSGDPRPLALGLRHATLMAD